MYLKKIRNDKNAFYRKGDSITIHAADAVWAGYIYHTETGIYLSFILDKPILANGASISLGQSSIGITTVTGLRTLSNLSVTDVSVARNIVSCVISGTFDGYVTKYQPITAGVTATITFT